MRCEWRESLLLLCERSECPGVRRVCEREREQCEHDRERLRVSRESTRARDRERMRESGSVSV